MEHKCFQESNGGVAAGFVALGAYEAVKPMAWDQLKLTGSNGYIAQAVVNMLPVLTPNLKDLTNFTEKSLGLATIAGLGYLVSSKKALNLLDQKMTMGAVGMVTVIYGVNLLLNFKHSTLEMYSELFQRVTSKTQRMLSEQVTTLAEFGMTNNTHHNMNVIGGAHNNMGMMHMGGHNMAGMHNYSMAGAHNQLQTANTAAIQRGAGRSGFFGTKRLRRCSCEPLLSLAQLVEERRMANG